MALKVTQSQNKKEKFDADKLGFGNVFSDHMLLAKAHDGVWGDMEIMPLAPLQLHPAATVLHYGQELFEGLKAYRSDDGRILMFRPKDNLERMNEGAVRAALPTFDIDIVFEAMCELVRLDQEWIPTAPNTSLYIRPNMFGVDPYLGVSSSSEVWLNIICSPSGPYYAGGLAPTRIYVEDQYVRATSGGIGFTKMGANYAASLAAGVKANELGFDQVLWLDAMEQRYIQEVGSMNIFFLFDDALVTPNLNGSILSGITRRSVITVAESLGVKVEERPLAIDEVYERMQQGELKEVFGSGTAAVVSPVGELYYKGQEFVVNDGKIGDLTQTLYDTITNIQYGRTKDTFGWTIEL